MPDYFDTHAHLSMLEQSPTEEILKRARANGVNQIVTVSTDPPNWHSNKELASENQGVFYSLGLHPHEASQWTKCAQELHDYFPDSTPPERCVAIGEMGLDYHYEHSPRELQIDAFDNQLMLAKKVGLPVIIHCRDAFEDLYKSIKKVGLGDKGGILHCFTGTTEEAKIGLDFGLKVSFSGILTFKKAEDLRETAKTIPLTELLIETDCPYLAPEPFRGKPNEPSFLPLTGRQLGLILGKTENEIAGLTMENALATFQL